MREGLSGREKSQRLRGQNRVSNNKLLGIWKTTWDEMKVLRSSSVLNNLCFFIYSVRSLLFILPLLLTSRIADVQIRTQPHAHTHTSTQTPDHCLTHAHTHTNTHTHTHTHTNACTYKRISACTHQITQLHMLTHNMKEKHNCTCSSANIHVHTHAHTNMHTRICGHTSRVHVHMDVHVHMHMQRHP